MVIVDCCADVHHFVQREEKKQMQFKMFTNITFGT